jgi:hypothetical protein
MDQEDGTAADDSTHHSVHSALSFGNAMSTVKIVPAVPPHQQIKKEKASPPRKPSHTNPSAATSQPIPILSTGSTSSSHRKEKKSDSRKPSFDDSDEENEHNSPTPMKGKHSPGKGTTKKVNAKMHSPKKKSAEDEDDLSSVGSDNTSKYLRSETASFHSLNSGP